MIVADVILKNILRDVRKLLFEFAKIPRDHVKADVRRFIAGTPEAEEAILLTQIPKTSVIRRSHAELDVVYDGVPRFRRISGLAAERRSNATT